MSLTDWLGRLPDDPDALSPWLDEGLALRGGDVAALGDLIKDASWRALGYDMARAVALARALVALGARHGEPNVQALGEMALGDALRLQMRIAEGMALLDQAAERFLASGHEIGWARTRIGWVGNLHSLPNAPEPGPSIERAARLFERGEHWLWYTLLCHNYAGYLQIVRRYADAVAWSERQLEAALRLTGDAQVVQRFRALGALVAEYILLGDRAATERYRTELLEWVDHPAIPPDLRAENQIIVGRSYGNFGHHAQAVAYMNRAAPDVRSENTRAYYLDLMAWNELRLNRLARSEAHFRELIGLQAEPGAEVNRSYARAALARLLCQRGAYEEALEQLLSPELEDLSQTQGAWALTRLTQLLLVAHELGRPELKAAALARIERWEEWEGYSRDIAEAWLAIALTSDDAATQRAAIEQALVAADAVPWLRWRVHQTQARLAPTMEERLRALDAAASDLDTTQSALTASIHSDFLLNCEEIYHDLALGHLALGDVESAWQSVERGKSRILLNARLRRESGGPSPLSPRQAELEELVARHLALTNARLEGEGLEEIRAVERAIRECHEAIDVEAAGDLDALAPGQIAPPRAPGGRTLVGYFLAREASHAFVHDGERYHHRPLPLRPSELEELVSGLNIQLVMAPQLPDAFQAQSLARVHRIVERLAEALIRPLEPLLAGEAITLVPFGPLHQLPFHLLRLDGRYLFERFDLRVVPTAERAVPDRAAPSGRRRHLVATHSAGGQLPHTTREGAAVAALLGGEGALFQEEAATRAALLGRLDGEFGVVHLAAHGQLRPDQPLLSHIQLADGQLTIGDLLARCVDASLVTLSACETARAALRPGDDPVSMGRAFLAAGACSLLGSLWLLDDESAVALMEAFYGRLVAGATKAEALRAVWQAWAEHSEPRRRHPFYWGALQLVGDGGPL